MSTVPRALEGREAVISDNGTPDDVMDADDTSGPRSAALPAERRETGSTHHHEGSNEERERDESERTSGRSGHLERSLDRHATGAGVSELDTNDNKNRDRDREKDKKGKRNREDERRTEAVTGRRNEDRDSDGDRELRRRDEGRDGRHAGSGRDTRERQYNRDREDDRRGDRRRRDRSHSRERRKRRSRSPSPKAPIYDEFGRDITLRKKIKEDPKTEKTPELSAAERLKIKTRAQLENLAAKDKDIEEAETAQPVAQRWERKDLDKFVAEPKESQAKVVQRASAFMDEEDLQNEREKIARGSIGSSDLGHAEAIFGRASQKDMKFLEMKDEEEGAPVKKQKFAPPFKPPAPPPPPAEKPPPPPELSERESVRLSLKALDAETRRKQHLLERRRMMEEEERQEDKQQQLERAKSSDIGEELLELKREVTRSNLARIAAAYGAELPSSKPAIPPPKPVSSPENSPPSSFASPSPPLSRSIPAATSLVHSLPLTPLTPSAPSTTPTTTGARANWRELLLKKKTT